jgi:Lar family restriction alleviation protein
MNNIIKFNRETLKPCPFCGSDNINIDVFEWDKEWTYYIGCNKCDAIGGLIHTPIPNNRLRQYTISKWNERSNK